MRALKQGKPLVVPLQSRPLQGASVAAAGVLDPERTSQIGIRGGAKIVVWRFSYQSGMTVVHIEDVRRSRIESLIQQAREVVGDGPTCICFDVVEVALQYDPTSNTAMVAGIMLFEILCVATPSLVERRSADAARGSAWADCAMEIAWHRNSS